jgi:hypothetical protein
MRINGITDSMSRFFGAEKLPERQNSPLVYINETAVCIYRTVLTDGLPKSQTAKSWENALLFG